MVGAVLLATTAAPLSAQPRPDDPSTDTNEIIITGQRVDDITAERTVDAEAVSAYGLGTVGEVLDEIMAEQGEDEDPVVLVNGERVGDFADVADYPAEAISRVDVLPRGTGVRVGASSQRRVYNVVLRKRVTTLTTGLAYRLATEGNWSGRRGEAIFTRIQGQRRLNVALRVRDEDDLLESDRQIDQPVSTVPFDLLGNIIPDPRSAGLQIDPVLSALAGRTILRAAVPLGATSPSLANFAATGDMVNLTDLGHFRTLRPDTTDYDLTVSAADRLAPWLTGSVNGRLNHSRSRSLFGLPFGTFILPEASPFSPFSVDVGLAQYGPQPLRQSYRSLSGNVNAALNAAFGRWQVYLTANYNHSDRRYATDRQDPAQLSAPILIGDGRNPFAGSLSDLLTVLQSTSRSLSNSGGAQLTVTGTPVKLPAGPLRVTAGAGLNLSELVARNSFLTVQPSTRFHRTERTLSASTDIPLATRRNGFLPALGELSATAEYGIADISRVGTLTRYAYGANWAPALWLRFSASNGVTKPVPDVQFLAEAVIITPGVRYFDFLRGETVDVTHISGGNPNLLGQIVRNRRFGVNAAPMKSINLQLNAEYSAIKNRNLISGLPPASEAILNAFPDRFIRDANGVLTTVDVRPVNFVRRAQEQIRYGFSFTVPLSGARPAAGAAVDTGPSDAEGEGPAAPSTPAALRSRPRLQVLAYHTFVLSDDVLIRPGLAPIDLLGREAIGLGGGRPRHQVEATVGVVDRGIGARLTGIWRSESFLNLRTAGSTSALRFSPLATFTLRTFAEARQLFPKAEWAKGARVTLSVANLLNDRQEIRDSTGVTPLRYQPGYRDPLGRTVELEFRKVF